MNWMNLLFAVAIVVLVVLSMRSEWQRLKRRVDLEAENARLREALERARNWVDFSARSLGAGVSSYAVAESLHHESARISADLSAPGLTDPQPAAGTEELS